jgi:hypothetical protein
MSSSTNTDDGKEEILNKISQIEDYLVNYRKIMTELDDPLSGIGRDRLDLLELENDFIEASIDLALWTRDRYYIDHRWQYYMCDD